MINEAVSSNMQTFCGPSDWSTPDGPSDPLPSKFMGHFEEKMDQGIYIVQQRDAHLFF